MQVVCVYIRQHNIFVKKKVFRTRRKICLLCFIVQLITGNFNIEAVLISQEINWIGIIYCKTVVLITFQYNKILNDSTYLPSNFKP